MDDRSNEGWHELLDNGPDLYFSQRVLVHSPWLYKYVYEKVRDKEESEDIEQEVLLRAYQALRNYFVLSDRQRIMVPKPWLKKIADNLLCDYWKRVYPMWYYSAVEDMFSQIEDQSSQPDEIAENSESQEELLECIGLLLKQDQDIIHYRYFQSLSHRQIAEQLNCLEGTARQRVNRAVDRLGKLWQRREGK